MYVDGHGDLVRSAKWQKKIFEKMMTSDPPNITLKALTEMQSRYNRRSAYMQVPEPSPEEMVQVLRKEVERLATKLTVAEDELVRKEMFINSQVHYKPAVNGMILEMFAKMRVLADGGTISKFELETLVAKIESNLNDDGTETATVVGLRKILKDTTEVE